MSKGPICPKYLILKVPLMRILNIPFPCISAVVKQKICPVEASSTFLLMLTLMLLLLLSLMLMLMTFYYIRHRFSHFIPKLRFFWCVDTNHDLEETLTWDETMIDQSHLTTNILTNSFYILQLFPIPRAYFCVRPQMALPGFFYHKFFLPPNATTGYQTHGIVAPSWVTHKERSTDWATRPQLSL